VVTGANSVDSQSLCLLWLHSLEGNGEGNLEDDEADRVSGKGQNLKSSSHMTEDLTSNGGVRLGLRHLVDVLVLDANAEEKNRDDVVE